MQPAAEPSPPALAAADRGIRVLPVEPPAERERRERLVQRLAADRLRDLRDDGVTTAYMARMYGVEPELIERLQAELVPVPRR
jgi:hypothetical protein